MYHSKVKYVQFRRLDSQTIHQLSHVQVINSDQYKNSKNGKPSPGGINDLHMGTIDQNNNCETCSHNQKKCPGHMGSVQLKVPIMSPLFMQLITNWTKMICFECGNIQVSDEKINKIKGNKFKSISSKINSKNDPKTIKCEHCGSYNPHIKKGEIFLEGIFYDYENDSEYTKTIYPQQIKDIFAKVTYQTMQKIDLGMDSHPSTLILDVLPIPDMSIRPNTRMLGNNKLQSDPITTILHTIVKDNFKLPDIINYDNPTDVKLLADLNIRIMRYIKGGGATATNTYIANDSSVSLIGKLKGKPGLPRQTIMGKTVKDMARSVITCNPMIPVGSVSLPLDFAKTLKVKETVTEETIDHLRVYYNNGVDKYPGCSVIYKQGDETRKYSVSGKNITKLEIGDIIERDLINGDYMLLNRQPSLQEAAICALEIIVNHNPDVETLRFNVLGCPFFNADFDGDQMNLIANSTLLARNEVMNNSSVANRFINVKNSAPFIGQMQDSMMGLPLLTDSDVKLSKSDVMYILSNTTLRPKLTKKEYTGREIINFTLPSINYSKKTESFKDTYAPYVTYKPDNIHLEIKNGEIQVGLIDKAAVGTSSGSLYHVIALKYGNTKALEVIFNQQQIAIYYLYFKGFTLNIRDFILPKEGRDEVKRIEGKLFTDANEIVEKLNKGQIIPPVGKTVEEFFEEQMREALKSLDIYLDPILRNIDPDNSNLFKMVQTKTKGSMKNIYSIMGSVGQILINGKRLSENFGYRRASPFCQRFSMDPINRGMIPHSYSDGLDVRSMLNGARNSRNDITIKALSTATTGEANRTGTKNLESLIVNNHRCLSLNGNIVQYNFGEDGINPVKLRKVKLKSVMMDDMTLQDEFYAGNKPIFNEEFTLIKELRDSYRKTWQMLENANKIRLIDDVVLLPVDITEIIRDLSNDKLDKFNKKDLEIMTKNVIEFANNFYQILYHENFKEYLPFKISSCNTLKYHILTTLNSKNLEKNNISLDKLKEIFEVIKIKYLNALVYPGLCSGILAAQSICEPLTQYMLDSQHRTGEGSSKSGVNRFNSNIKTKDSSASKSMMIIPVKEQYKQNKSSVQELANSIEPMSTKLFVHKPQIFVEEFNVIIHPKYEHENKMIREFVKYNKLKPPPTNLVNFCIRLELNKSTLIMKNMSIEYLVQSLYKKHKNIYLVYSPQNSSELILRIYFENTAFKNSIVTKKLLLAKKDEILDTVLRGVKGIYRAKVINLTRNRINEDGSIEKIKEFAIETEGTNLYEIMLYKNVEHKSVISTNVMDTFEMFGIEAARNRIISEFREVLASQGINTRFYAVYADTMCMNGIPLSIDKTGQKAREYNNILLRIATSHSVQAITDAGNDNVINKIYGISAPLMVGTVPDIGTIYNKFIINEDFVKNNTYSLDDDLNF